ncbi:MAG: OmpA family protein [Microscillaceae bacterium]|nr:OmpA family protein [Microscillaceae bacterium]
MRKTLLNMAWGICLGISCLLAAQAQDPIVAESPTYDQLGIHVVALQVNCWDAEIASQPVSAYLRVRLADMPVFIDTIQKSGPQMSLLLPINRVYELVFRAEKYLDTTLRIDFAQINDYELKLELGLKPDKIGLDIQIRDLNTDETLPLGGIVKNLYRPEAIYLNPREGREGFYQIRVREEDEYEMEVKSEQGYLFYTQNRIVPKRGLENRLDVKVVRSLAPGHRIPLQDVSFAYNDFSLSEQARSELDRVVPLLLQYPALLIEIAAHTDSDGTDAHNLRLSFLRAEAVQTYLLARGLSPSVLSVKGYGATQPIASNLSPEGKARNRRFELRVLRWTE